MKTLYTIPKEVQTEPNSSIWNQIRILILYVNKDKEVPCFIILLENLIFYLFNWGVFFIKRNETAYR